MPCSRQPSSASRARCGQHWTHGSEGTTIDIAARRLEPRVADKLRLVSMLAGPSADRAVEVLAPTLRVRVRRTPRHLVLTFFARYVYCAIPLREARSEFVNSALCTRLCAPGSRPMRGLGEHAATQRSRCHSPCPPAEGRSRGPHGADGGGQGTTHRFRVEPRGAPVRAPLRASDVSGRRTSEDGVPSWSLRTLASERLDAVRIHQYYRWFRERARNRALAEADRMRGLKSQRGGRKPSGCRENECASWLTSRMAVPWSTSDARVSNWTMPHFYGAMETSRQQRWGTRDVSKTSYAP